MVLSLKVYVIHTFKQTDVARAVLQTPLLTTEQFIN